MKIVLATDGSKDSAEALKWTAQLCENNAVELWLTHIVRSPDELYFTEAFDLVEVYRKKAREKAAALLAEYRPKLELAGAKVHESIKEGHAGHQITFLAKNNHADLIVIGARGHSVLDRLMMGSTSEYVANHAECSVAIVRPSNSSLNAHKLALAHDGSDHAQKAMRVITGLNWPDNVSLDLVSVIERPALIPDDVAYDQALTESTEKTMDGVANSVRSKFNSVRTHVVESVEAGRGVCQFARDQGSSILVVGDHGRGAIRRFFMGSVSRHCMHHAPCTVWIVR